MIREKTEALRDTTISAHLNATVTYGCRCNMALFNPSANFKTRADGYLNALRYSFIKRGF